MVSASLTRRNNEWKQTHAYARNVAIIVNQAPLMTDKVQPEYVVVDFIRILIKSSKGIYLIVSAIRHRGVHETSGSLA